MTAPTGHRRRYGRFKVAAQFARDFDSTLKRIMGMCIVLRAEHHLEDDTIEYLAISEHFEPVAFGAKTPWYRWFSTGVGEVSVQLAEWSPLTEESLLGGG